MFDLIMFFLIICIVGYCVQKASEQSSVKRRFYRMLPVIILLVALTIREILK